MYIPYVCTSRPTIRDYSGQLMGEAENDEISIEGGCFLGFTYGKDREDMVFGCLGNEGTGL